jgi:hypothetical protein
MNKPKNNSSHRVYHDFYMASLYLLTTNRKGIMMNKRQVGKHITKKSSKKEEIKMNPMWCRKINNFYVETKHKQ